jgi:hypothetical protein
VGAFRLTTKCIYSIVPSRTGGLVGFLNRIKELIQEIEQAKSQSEGPVVITRLGRRFEQSFLGYTLRDEDNLYFNPEEYISFVEALQEMMETQPVGYDPSSPTDGGVVELFQKVKDILEKDRDDLRLYIAVGTRMDFFHGVDAVFSWHNVNVTIDVTVDPNKEYKSDICLRPCDVEDEDVFRSTAENIAIILKYRDEGKTVGRLSTSSKD